MYREMVCETSTFLVIAEDVVPNVQVLGYIFEFLAEYPA